MRDPAVSPCPGHQQFSPVRLWPATPGGRSVQEDSCSPPTSGGSALRRLYVGSVRWSGRAGPSRSTHPKRRPSTLPRPVVWWHDGWQQPAAFQLHESLPPRTPPCSHQLQLLPCSVSCERVGNSAPYVIPQGRAWAVSQCNKM